MTAGPDISNHSRAITAHHEAGHAVAVCARYGEITSITIQPTSNSYGLTEFNAAAMDRPFITYAGLWAEARFHWPRLTLDGVDENRRAFNDYFCDAWKLNCDGDVEAFRRHSAYDPRDFEAKLLERQTWRSEIVGLWDAIQGVAQLLQFDELVTTDVVNSLIRAHSGG
jgi:hypothetical protein